VNRKLVVAEWRRAQQALRAAEILTKEACFADAVSRTYYAVLNAARAALQAKSVAADTHGGVRRMFGLHLIKTGEIEKPYARSLGAGFDDRLAADYDAEATFTEVEARRECRSARRFLQRIRRFLLANGFPSSDLRERKPGKRKP
jgi:uncharacterized protein (UPF0332 family)